MGGCGMGCGGCGMGGCMGGCGMGCGMGCGGGFGKGFGMGKGCGKGSFGGPPSLNLHIKGLPEGYDNEALKTVFQQYGQVLEAHMAPAEEGKLSTTGFVRMVQEDA